MNCSNENKKINKILLLIILIFLGISFFTYSFNVRKIFYQESWKNDISERKYMLKNLTKRHQLIGMSKSEILELLGPDDLSDKSPMIFPGDDNEYFAEDTLIYFLGPYRLDTLWLIISFDNNIVINYQTRLTS